MRRASWCTACGRVAFLSVWFLTLSAIAAFAGIAEVVIALVLLVAAVPEGIARPRAPQA